MAYPQPYTFETPWFEGGGRIELTGNVIEQGIIIDADSRWDGESYYGIYFCKEGELTEGYLKISLVQNGEPIQISTIDGGDIEAGYYCLKDWDFAKLAQGIAYILIDGRELKQSLYLAVLPNNYNLPNCYVNNQEQECVLAQTYHYYHIDYEYYLRIMAYTVFVLVNVVSFFIVLRQENKKSCLWIRILLSVGSVCLIFVYDSALLLSPICYETVTNFLHNALNFSFFKNILLTDAGYLPIFQRLLTLFIIKVLRIPAYYAAYIMQLAACFITGLALSFFCSIQYKKYFELRYRYLLCLLFMMQINNRYMEFFFNFITVGVIVIFLYFLADSREWSKTEFIVLCLWGMLVCLSKGAYVTCLPFFFLCFILFFKKYNKRDKIFMFLCAAASLLQLFYYLVQGSDWLDRTGSSADPEYIYKLVCSILIDVPNCLLAIFGANTAILNGVAFLVIISFWSIVIDLFVKNVIYKYLKKESIENDFRNLFMMFAYIMAQSLFFRITVYGVSSNDIMTEEFWAFSNRKTIDKYYIFMHLAAICCFIIFVKLLAKRNIKELQKRTVISLVICLMIFEPRMQIKGISKDTFSQERTYISSLNADMNMLKDFEDVPCRAVPITPNSVYLGRNCNLYVCGKNIYGSSIYDEGSVIEVENTEVSSGRIDFDEWQPLNLKENMWGLFVFRTTLVNDKIYQVILRDESGNILVQKMQNNTRFQNIVSFAFDEGISNVHTVEILDSDNQPVSIQNVMYVVTERQ